MYNESLDSKLASKEVFSDGGQRLTVAIYQYNGSAPKVQIKRERNTKNGTYTFAKLGRLTEEELQAVATGLQWAAQTLENIRQEGSKV